MYLQCLYSGISVGRKPPPIIHVILRYGKIKVYDMADSFCLLFYMGHIGSCEHAFMHSCSDT